MATKRNNTNTAPKARNKTAAKGAKTAPKAATPKAAPAKDAPAKAEGKLSLVKAAIAVLAETDEAMNTKQLVEAAKAKGYWTPTAGKTPTQTLYSAIVRDIKAKGERARFKQVGKGRFQLNSAE